MRERTVRPDEVGTAAAVIGGALAIVLPQHGLNIVQLVIVTAAVSAALYALSVNVPTTGWLSPFKWGSPFNQRADRRRQGRGPNELRSIRAKLSGWRQPIENGPPLPPAVLRFLKPLIAVALDLGLDDGPPPTSSRGAVSPLTWAVLTAEPIEGSLWFRTLPPNPREVTDIVHTVLDDLDRVAGGTNGWVKSLTTATHD